MLHEFKKTPTQKKLGVLPFTTVGDKNTEFGYEDDDYSSRTSTTNSIIKQPFPEASPPSSAEQYFDAKGSSSQRCMDKFLFVSHCHSRVFPHVINILHHQSNPNSNPNPNPNQFS